VETYQITRLLVGVEKVETNVQPKTPLASNVRRKDILAHNVLQRRRQAKIVFMLTLLPQQIPHILLMALTQQHS